MIANKQKTAIVMLVVVAWLDSNEILCAFGSRPAFILIKRIERRHKQKVKQTAQCSATHLLLFRSSQKYLMLETADIFSVGEIYCMCLICFVLFVYTKYDIILLRALGTTPIPSSLMDIYIEAQSH